MFIRNLRLGRYWVEAFYVLEMDSFAFGQTYPCLSVVQLRSAIRPKPAMTRPEILLTHCMPRA